MQCFLDTIQPPCGPGAYTLAEKETQKITKSKKQNTAEQQTASNIISSSISLEEPAEEKDKKRNKNVTA